MKTRKYVIIVCLILAVLAFGLIPEIMETTAKEKEAATQEEVATQDTDEIIDNDDAFVQKWTKNEKHRLDSEFAQKLQEAAGTGVITGEIVKKEILNNCAHDVRHLAIWANAFGFHEDPNKYEDLLTTDKSYLSERGRELYYKLAGALETVRFERELVPENGTNTGYDNGFVVAETAGVGGDRAGTKISVRSGDVLFWAKDNCANIIYPPGTKPPKVVPPGKTDNPDPPEETPGKNLADDPVNRGKAQIGGGQGKDSDGSGDYQSNDPRTENPTGNGNNNSQGHSDPGTVRPVTPLSSSGEDGVVHENKMDYKPDPVTNRGPVDATKPPTESEGDGEFTPED